MNKVWIKPKGDEINTCPSADDRAGLKAALARGVSADFMSQGREQPAEQVQPELDMLFP